MKQQLLILVFAFIWGLTSGQNPEALTHKITEEYDDDTDTYIEVLKETYSYFSNGKLSGTEYSYIGASDWTASVKVSYKYNDSNGYLEETITSNWNQMSNTFMNNSRDVITYDGNLMKEQTSYNWDNNAWERDDKTTFNYEGNTLKSFDTYEWENSQWIKDGKGTIAYDDQQKIREIITEELENSLWVFEDRTTYQRDPATGRISEIIYETWDGSLWKKEDKDAYTSDADGNRLMEIYSESTDGASWTEEDKIEYDYDFNTLMSKYNHPFNLNAHLQILGVDDVPHHNKVVSNLQSDNDSFNFPARGQASWEVETRTIYYYSDDTMGLKDLSDSDFMSIYPNPVKNLLNIKLKEAVQAKAMLYDINGRLVMDQQLQPLNTALNIESINAGLYMLKVETDVGYANKRITKH